MPASTLEQTPAALALQRSAIPALRQLSLAESDVTVEIHGCVASYYLKQLAQEAVKPALEGRALRNLVTVHTTSQYAP